MTIEENLETRLVDLFAEIFAGANLNIQVFGLLNSADGLKGEEKPDVDGVMIVKVRPRSYQTPTIPECQIQVDVSMTCRADKDYNGKSFSDVFGILIDTFQQWQRCLDDAHTAFAVEGMFDCTGYVLNDGDTAIDASGKTWIYTHSMTVYGVVIYTQTETTNN